MSYNDVINEKKKALLAYKEKILDEIKYYEKTIDDFCANHRNSYYDDDNDSSDSDDDFPTSIDTGPSAAQLKLQQAMLKTCLHATQELTSLMVLQSEVDVLVEEPKYEGECPVTEPGTWKEVTVECRIDLVPFTMTFYMHTPSRKFAPPSYRGLRVVPVKSAHELELANSVLHSLKLPSDAVEVLRSYAAGYRSRRTTLARLANKYTNTLFMEPHPEGGFILKCADLLEVSWRLENKWSPVAPFHHRMKFDLEYMDEIYIKKITLAHKKLLDPAIQTDERTLLLAEIITTCLEARGPLDPESDLESKTTERDNDIDKQESENKKRDSEVMAPPKSLPKKVKQKTQDGVTAQKRGLDDNIGDDKAKKFKNDDGVKKNVVDNSNSQRKSKMNDVATETSKKRKINEVTSKNVKDIEDGGVKTKNAKKTNGEEKKLTDNNSKTKNKKQVGNTEDDNAKANKNENVKASNVKESENIVAKNNVKAKILKNTEGKENKNGDTNSTPKNIKDLEKTETKNNPKNKNMKKADDKITNTNSKPKNMIASENIEAKNSAKTKKTDENTVKNKVTKEAEDATTKKQKETTNIDKTNKAANIIDNKHDNIKPKEKSNDNIQTKDSITKNKTVNTEKVNNKPKNKTTKEINKLENDDKTKKAPKNLVNVKSKENIDVNKMTDDDTEGKVIKKTSVIKNTNTNINKITKTNINNIQKTKNDILSKKTSQKPQVVNKATEKVIKENIVHSNDNQTVTERNATNAKIKDKISHITAKLTVKDKAPTGKVISNITTKKNIEITKPTTKLIAHKISSHRTSLKPQNPTNILKAGNTKTSTGSTGKENGGKISKIPQKKLSMNSEGSSKQNLLRISPRKIPSKFKSLSQETFKQKMVKSTNIPRLLKKPAQR